MRAALLSSLIALATVAHARPAVTAKGPLAGATQLVLVTASDWSSTTGELRRYRRGRGAWIAVGKPVAVSLGKSGLGWGRGLHGGAPNPPIKQEGDGKTPAGAFRIASAFGYAATGNSKLPYRMLGSSIECVDDPSSQSYNTLVDKKTVAKPDWSSAEHMLRADGLYRIGAIVDHNADHPVANGGSCIFLHIARGPGSPTVGCTAMDADALAAILAWLDPAAHPVLVQLPVAVRATLRATWGLP